MVPDNQRLAEISTLGKDFVDLNNEIKELEDRLSQAKKKFNYLSSELLPYAMQTVGMTSFEIGNRYTIKTEPVLVVKADKEKMQEIDSWLDQHGHAGMVKFKLEVFLPKSIAKEELGAIEDQIEQLGYNYTLTKSIHHQTLAKWGREMDENGEVIPEEIFNVYRATKTVIME